MTGEEIRTEIEKILVVTERARITREEIHVEMERALVVIARGREDCGLPLAREVARNIARESLIKVDVRWSIPP